MVARNPFWWETLFFSQNLKMVARNMFVYKILFFFLLKIQECGPGTLFYKCKQNYSFFLKIQDGGWEPIYINKTILFLYQEPVLAGK